MKTKEYKICNARGIVTRVSLIFESASEFLSDDEIYKEAKQIDDVLRRQLPVMTYFELRKLMRKPVLLEEFWE